MDTEPQLYSPPLTHWAMPRCVCAQLCLTLCHPMDCSLPGFSLPGIFQARILEWVAISSSRGSPQTRGQSAGSCVSYLARQLLYHWATWEAHFPNQTISSSHLLEHILPLSFLPPSRELPSFWLFLWMVSSFSGLNFNVFHELRSLFTNLHRSHPLFAITTPVYFFPHLTNLFWVQVCGKKLLRAVDTAVNQTDKKKKKKCVPSWSCHLSRRSRSCCFCCCWCSVAESCLTLWPHGLQHPRLPCPSFSQSLLKLTSIELMMPSSHLILPSSPTALKIHKIFSWISRYLQF